MAIAASPEGAPKLKASQLATSTLLSQPSLAWLLLLLLLAAAAWLATRRGRGAPGRPAAGGGTEQRDTVVLVGPSGAGKTVLLHQVRGARGETTTRPRRLRAVVDANRDRDAPPGSPPGSSPWRLLLGATRPRPAIRAPRTAHCSSCAAARPTR